MALNSRSTVRSMAAALLIALVIVSSVLSSTYAEDKEDCHAANPCDLSTCTKECKDKAHSKGSQRYTATCKHYGTNNHECCCTVHT